MSCCHRPLLIIVIITTTIVIVTTIAAISIAISPSSLSVPPESCVRRFLIPACASRLFFPRCEGRCLGPSLRFVPGRKTALEIDGRLHLPVSTSSLCIPPVILSTFPLVAPAAAFFPLLSLSLFPSPAFSAALFASTTCLGIPSIHRQFSSPSTISSRRRLHSPCPTTCYNHKT